MGPRSRRSFPSVHVYLSLICAYYLSFSFPPYATLFWACAVLVTASTVFIKQHNLVDIAGGILWAALAVSASQAIVSHL